MKPAELRASVSKTPFRPFRLKLRDGREIVCNDPDGWCITETGSTLLIIRRGREPYVRLTAAEVASVEPHNQAEPVQETRLMPMTRDDAYHLLWVLTVPVLAS